METKTVGFSSDLVVSVILCLTVFLAPLFVLPFGVNQLAFGKAMLLYGLTAVTLLIWLIARLKAGRVTFPKSYLFISLLAIVLVWLVSSFFSLNIPLSLFGAGSQVGTTAFFLFLGVLLFFTSIIVSGESRATVFYFSLFASGFVAFVIQLIHTVFRLPIPFLDSYLNGPTGNLVGGWNDFGIFFGFLGLTALSFFELLAPKFFGARDPKKIKPLRMGLLIFVVLSFAVLFVVNFTVLSYVFGFTVMFLLVYLFSRSFFDKTGEGHKNNNSAPLYFSFFVLLASIAIILATNFVSIASSRLNTGTLDVRPSFQTTMGIARQVLATSPVFGSGPATFLYDWLALRPQAVNDTIFWNARFEAGISHLMTMFATTGALGGIAILLFFGIFLSYGLKAISYTGDPKTRAFLVSSFLGSLYLWIFTAVYSSGFLVYALAFIITGLFVGLLTGAGRIKTVHISFLENPKIGFLSTLVTIILIIGSVATFYFLFQKIWAAKAYADGLNAMNSRGDIDSAKASLVTAVNFDPQDIYYRGLTEVSILEIQRLLNRRDLTPEDARATFQTALGTAIQNAKDATRANSLDPLNWAELARVYELIVPLRVDKADQAAVDANLEALKRSPFDPTSYLSSARVKIQVGDNNGAREFINKALALKNDFAPAIFLLSQLEVQEGHTSEAILRSEQAATLAPNDVGALFQLGFLQYQNKNYDRARVVFERAVALNPGYANARYFLGLIYEREERKTDAIVQFEKIQATNPDNAEVQNILSNLRAGRPALQNISPPGEKPEKRKQPPVSDSGR